MHLQQAYVAQTPPAQNAPGTKICLPIVILFRLSLWRPATTLLACLTIVVVLDIFEVLALLDVLALFEVFSTPRRSERWWRGLRQLG